jgi:transposase InsO family protein
MEVVITVARITEEHMIPALKHTLATCPFKIKGFHSDNGSERINYGVAELLEKMRVDFTKLRPRRSNDNGLVESKKWLSNSETLRLYARPSVSRGWLC